MKKLEANFFLSVLVFVLMAQAAKQITDAFAIPNVFAIPKEIGVVALALLALNRSRFLFDSGYVIAFFLILLFVGEYLMVAAFQGRVFMGLYFVRLYLIPLMFLTGALYFVQIMDARYLQKSLLVTCWINFIFIAVAVALYFSILLYPELRIRFFGSAELAHAWYLAGANILRMGLPFVAPNNMGFYLASTMMVLLANIAANRHLGKSNLIGYVLLLINCLALVMTFSRSAMLMLVIGGALYLIIPGIVDRKAIFSTMLSIVVGLVVAIIALAIVDEVTGGTLHKWFALNVSRSDPSMQGHARSIYEAVENFHEYYIIGYEKGTVGPKAALFTLNIHNVENSLFAVLYDVGIFGFFILSIAYFLLLQKGFSSRYQLPVLISFLVVLQLLPYIYEPELIVYFLFCYLLIGCIGRMASGKESNESVGFGVTRQVGYSG